jgi:hypothetical protein
MTTQKYILGSLRRKHLLLGTRPKTALSGLFSLPPCHARINPHSFLANPPPSAYHIYVR